MRQRFSWFILLLVAVFLIVIDHGCQNRDKTHEEATDDPTTYLNLSDSATYVGIGQCRLCHQKIADTFIHTGMGSSFDTAHKGKSVADFNGLPQVKDDSSSYTYYPFWRNDSLIFREVLQNVDFDYSREEHINYIIGSGQHTNSHLIDRNGYVYQAPLTFYTQDGRWDLPPGFEHGRNTRFSRKIGLECMTCHNGYPGFVKGSENKFVHVPNGIDCERCHGPGSIHVEQKKKGIVIDTSQYIDYSIVNPAKLPVDLQFDICQRCHLQGNAVLAEGKSFLDFKPGKKLSNVMTVFLPRYKQEQGDEQDFIMASHVDRLKMSKCFQKSFNTQQFSGLRPYKDALTCVTCHNPHISVVKTSKQSFNNKCNSCHQSDNYCSNFQSFALAEQEDCIGCHMPKSGSSDIPHVRITDHFIRRPIPEMERTKLREFERLVSINNKRPNRLTKANAYLNQFEKFKPLPVFLDSAKYFLSRCEQSKKGVIKAWIRFFFLKKSNKETVNFVSNYGADTLLSMLNETDYANEDAWTCYRVGQSYYNVGNLGKAVSFFERASKLAPFVSSFKNKLASTLFVNGKEYEATEHWLSLLLEEPGYVPAHTNLGYAYLKRGRIDIAEYHYDKALNQDPKNKQALTNMVGLFVFKKDKESANEFLKRLSNFYPEDNDIKELKKTIKQANE